MTESDLPSLARIFTAANPQDNVAGIREYTKPTLWEFPQFCWVAEDSLSGKLVGGITGYINAERHVGYVMDIAVDSEFQHLGWGEQLMRQEIQAFTAVGIKIIELKIHFLNARVVPFYSRYGFRLQAVKLDEFGPGHDAIEMVYKQN